MRRTSIKRYREKSRKVKTLKSQKVKSRKVKTKKTNKKNYFKPGNRLNDEQKKYCRCVYHVAAQQTPECLRRRKWTDQSKNPKDRNPTKCYNPYAICSKSVKRKGRIECYKNTRLQNLPLKERKALAALKQIKSKQMK